MIPSTYNAVGMPSPVFFAPTTNNRGIPPNKGQQYHQPSSTNGVRQSNGADPHPARLLTVDEALQYSALSSVVPFSPDVIPLPNVSLPSSQAIFSTASEQQVVRQSIQVLDEDIGRTKGQSALTQHALQNLLPYLDRGSITRFKFKTPSGFNSSHPDPHFPTNDHVNIKPSTHLGPFANMLLQATDLSHRYPTPKSPGTSPHENHTSQKTSRQSLPVTPTTPQRFVQNQAAYSQNGLYPTSDISLSTAERKKLYPVVLVPPLSAESRQSYYITTPDGPSNQEVSRKRKRDTGIENIGDTTKTIDQRSISDDASRVLQELVQEILEADDQSDLALSGIKLSEISKFFVPVGDGDQMLFTLAPATQVKLETSMQKAIALGRFGDVPVDHLSRLQKICQVTLTSAETVEIHIETGWNEDDALQWAQKIEVAYAGLRSARIIVRTMVGGREEKQLCSEELLQSVLDMIKRTLDSCVIPVVESRATGSTSELYDFALPFRKIISQLLYDTDKVLRLLTELLAKVELAETTITAMEFFAARILFVENAQTEKDSVLGIQKFESVRRTAMDILAEIFSRYPEQRTFLIDEILISLQKLPVTRQHARQYKLPDGKTIQLVSALIMRLVQTSAIRSTTAAKKQKKRPQPKQDGEVRISQESPIEESTEDESTSTDTDSHYSKSNGGSESVEKDCCDAALQRLHNDVISLSESANKSAQHVVQFFVQRALTAPKTGDQPHRHLLDIFSEDLIKVLGLAEWPAAEILLRAFLAQMINIAEHEKSPAPAKNMALELLGLMGSAISELGASTEHLARSLENDDSKLSKHLVKLLDEYTDGKLEDIDLFSWDGPYRTVMEYYQTLGLGDSLNASARGYYLTQWAKAVSSGDRATSESGEHSMTGHAIEKLAIRLRKMLPTSKWNFIEWVQSFQPVSNSQGCLAYALTVLSMGFCRAFERVLKILFDSISSEQITVRTRSLKSVTQMLERDPTLLDRAPNVIRLIIKCASDKSPMVRDSALVLIGKCILLRPALEQEVCKTLLVLTNDPAVGVKKRSMRMLKDVYLRNARKDMKAAIADNLLQRVKDPDKGVSDLARQTFEDIWLSNFWTSSNSNEASVLDKIAIKEQVRLIIRTAQRGEGISSLLVSWLQEVLSSATKNATSNFRVCQSMVAVAFEDMVDTEELPEQPEQRHILQSLTIFAKANARLFTTEQLRYLQPYIGNLSSADDLYLFRFVVIIFRCVLPMLSSVQHAFLLDIQNALLQSVSKLGKAELDEVVACLWTINGLLKNPEKLAKLTASVLKHMYNLKDLDFSGPNQKASLDRVKKYISIAGHFGKHCDFENHVHGFEEARGRWKSHSVAGTILSSIKPFADRKQPLSLRAVALDSIGLICQSWPNQFNQENISGTFQDVFNEGHPELQTIILSSFRDFFARQDRQAEAIGADVVNHTNPATNEKLGGSMTASDSDGASALIAQRFLKNILQIALASQDMSALTATQVIGSINRQGLVHPKECGPALVALETSTNRAIADIAFKEHRNLHQQHESMFEREYMRSIQEAFRYQKDVIKNTLGVTMHPVASKFRPMFEIIKTSKGKYQKKFLSNLCTKIDFDPVNLDVSATPPYQLQFSRFLTENLAFFEYGRLDELLHTITYMEKIVSGTGAGVAHSIATVVFHETVLEATGEVAQVRQGAEGSDGDLDAVRLLRLTTASIILSILWEARTYLRRLYGLGATQQRRDSKAKAPSKDLSKAPTKVQGVSGDRLLIAIAEKAAALNNTESMLNQCKEFVELLSIDHEVKVVPEGDEDQMGPETPSGDDNANNSLPSSGGPRTLKRKRSASLIGTPLQKKKIRPSLGKRKKSGKSVDEEDDLDFEG